MRFVSEMHPEFEQASEQSRCTIDEKLGVVNVVFLL